MAVVRAFRAGDGPGIVSAWHAAAPSDALSEKAFLTLILLDENFDPDLLLVAVDDDQQVIGAIGAAVRRIPHPDVGLDPGTGWITFVFVAPAHRRCGIGRQLIRSVGRRLASAGASRVRFSDYTPGYVRPGIEASRYPEGAALLAERGFLLDHQVDAMSLSLTDYRMPARVADRVALARSEGWDFRAPTADEYGLLDRLAGVEFHHDWAQVMARAVSHREPADCCVAAIDPTGVPLGWAMFGAVGDSPDRFGPFGLHPAVRGQGIGLCLLHMTLERMKSRGSGRAWFLWADHDTAAHSLYVHSGFLADRTFDILQAPIDGLTA
jgi:GNAT superfamily N-acetyltransferase